MNPNETLTRPAETPVQKPRTLKYLLVHDWLPTLGGSELVFQEICSMFEGPVVSSLCNMELLPWLKDREVRTSKFQGLPFAFWRHYIFAPWMPSFYRNFRSDGFDVLLVDSHSFAHHVRRTPNSVYICYYYTSARALWNPEIDNRAHTGRLATIRRWITPWLRKMDLAASLNPEYIIAISHTTADRIRKNYGREVDEVIYPPVHVKQWLDTPHHDESEGFLMWGRLIDYKRVDLAIEAAKITGFRLNIVGSGPQEVRLKELAAGCENIVFRGRLADPELKKLMAHSKAVLFPGYEDFGIVPVEAMAAGLPVIAYGQGGAAETVGGYGLLLNNQDADELAEKMREIQTMTFNPDELKQNAARFDVEVFRARYVEAVERAVARFGSKLARTGTAFESALK